MYFIEDGRIAKQVLFEVRTSIFLLFAENLVKTKNEKGNKQ